MTMRIILLAVLLVASGTTGWLLANHWGEGENAPAAIGAGSVKSAVRIGPPPLVPDATPEQDQRVSPLEAHDEEPRDDDARFGDVLMQLQIRLDQEAAQRRLLERRVHELTERLARFENSAQIPEGRPLATLAAAPKGDEARDDPAALAKVRTTRFMSVGFSEEDERQLTRRMGEVEMERLYLRDTARREGWLRTPQYREAANELRNQLRNEMGEDTYDRLLYANERDNRVLVNSILESSPAQEIGLQPGDVIVRYDGSRVFSYRDIRIATRRGEMGDPVPLHVERNGEVLELEIPRGPLGVQLGSSSVIP